MVQLIIVVAVGVAIWWTLTHGRRRWLIRQLQAKATAMGLRAEPDPRPLPRRFAIPGAGSGSVADLMLVDPTTGATAFRHRYTVGREQGCTEDDLHVLVPLPCNAPHVLLRQPTVLNRIGARLGLRDTEIGDHDLVRRLGLVDVKVGHEGFDRTWQVSTDDERFARLLASGHIAGALIQRARFGDSALRYEFFGPWLLVSGPDWSVDTAAQLLGWCLPLPASLPPDLSDRYALPPMPVDPWV